jgi:four helix bundle protein
MTASPPLLAILAAMQTKHMPPFADWERGSRSATSGDPLWTLRAFRLAIYAIECDVCDRRVNSRVRNAATAPRLTRALGAIGVHLAEGFAHGSDTERVRFYGLALGNVREAIVWYGTLREPLGEVVERRLATLVEIRRLMLATVRRIGGEWRP